MYGDKNVPHHASHFVPKFVVGARLPHVWILPSNATVVQSLPPVDVSYVTELPVEEMSKREYSILDLCAIDAFTVILGDLGPKEAWADRLREQCASFGPKTNVYTLGSDFELAPVASAKEWLDRAGLAHGRAFLMRPDQHILMCFSALTQMEQILKVMDAHLGR